MQRSSDVTYWCVTGILIAAGLAAAIDELLRLLARHSTPSTRNKPGWAGWIPSWARMPAWMRNRDPKDEPSED